MNEDKLISIILPVYNGADYLSMSIDSILYQTYKNWELIIVNDCSIDDTLSIAKEYEKRDSRIKVVSNEKNLRLPMTLNRGFEEASGYYYTWTSHDNIYKPDALKKMKDVLEENISYAMVYADYTYIDDSGKRTGEMKNAEPENIVRGNMVGACFLYTAEIAKKIGNYDQNLFLAEDYDYWIRIYLNGKLKHLSESLYYYRRHSKSLTETKKALVNMQTYKVLEKNFLPLYKVAKQNNMENFLFDQMLERVNPAYKEETKRMLLCVNSRYDSYLKRRSFHRKLSNSFCGKTYRALKGMIRK